MEIKLIKGNNQYFAEIISDEIELRNAQNALDIMVNSIYNGARKIIIPEKNILPAFFDLKTGVAGEILQKFSTYRCQLAIIGDFGKFNSQSLKDFIFESNKQGRINFVSSLEEARKSLAKDID